MTDSTAVRVAPVTSAGSGLDTLAAVLRRWRLLVVGPVLIGGMALAVSFTLPKVYLATTVILPPQQAQSAAASVLASLGALAGAVGSSGGSRSPGDQYVALMQSTTLEGRIISAFKLDQVYETQYRFQTHRVLKERVLVAADRRSGLISIAVEDQDPKRAADMANAYVSQLRSLTSELAITEAQQRRSFFEQQLQRTRDRLTSAQRALQESGFDQTTLRAEPKSAADGYAKLMAELTAAEIKLKVMRGYLTEQASELQQQAALVAGLRSQVEKIEAAPRSSGPGKDPDYLSRYREFKYQEALFELFARQYEAARVDESREGPLVQVIDQATVPEYKIKPKRGLIALLSALLAFMLLLTWVLGRHWLARGLANDPALVAGLESLRQAVRRS